jgi:hypothetical protein
LAKQIIMDCFAVESRWGVVAFDPRLAMDVRLGGGVDPRRFHPGYDGVVRHTHLGCAKSLQSLHRGTWYAYLNQAYCPPIKRLVVGYFESTDFKIKLDRSGIPR